MTTPTASPAPENTPNKARSADRPIRWRRALLLTALAPLGFVLQWLAGLAPEWTERYYARGIYPWIEQALSTIASWSPIAIGESLLLLTIAHVLFHATRGAMACVRRRRHWRNLLLRGTALAFSAFGVLFLLFQVLWAINHSRLPFATQIDLKPVAVEPSRLARLAALLAERATAIRPANLDRTKPFLPDDWRRAVGDAYDAAGAELPVLAGPRPAIHGAWISRWMTLSSVTGIYSPFTGEPNINVDTPQLMQPFVACHEVAHLRGYAREDEADFIAYYVGTRSKGTFLAYSCELMAYRVAMIYLLHADLKAAIEVQMRTSPEVTADNQSIDDFWEGQPKTASRILTKITQTTNDLYLKSSGHKEGVRSYGRMLDLLIAYYGV
jgi:hypothetical protein